MRASCSSCTFFLGPHYFVTVPTMECCFFHYLVKKDYKLRRYRSCT